MLLLAYANVPPGYALLLIGGIGAGLTAGCVGQATLSVATCPPELRTTAIGCAAAVGRLIGLLLLKVTAGAQLRRPTHVPDSR